MLISAAEDADLMDPASWSVTPPLAFDPAWFADVQPLLPIGGYLEGAHLCRSSQAVFPAPCMPTPSPSICCMQSDRQQYEILISCSVELSAACRQCCGAARRVSGPADAHAAHAAGRRILH